jgi:hypothetical protein
VHLGTAATVRLKSAFGHDLVGLLLEYICAGQTISIKEQGCFLPVCVITGIGWLYELPQVGFSDFLSAVQSSGLLDSLCSAERAIKANLVQETP